MAMMKARKAKRYAEGGAIEPNKSFTTYVPPGTGYRPGANAEHLYFAKTPGVGMMGANTSTVTPDATQQAAFNQYNHAGGAGGSDGGSDTSSSSTGPAADAAADAASAAAGESGSSGPGDGDGDGGGGGGDGDGGGGGFKKGGPVKPQIKRGSLKSMPIKNMAKGGVVKSGPSRGDGCAARGKTKGRMV